VNKMALNFLNIQFQDSIVVKTGKLVGQLHDHFNERVNSLLGGQPISSFFVDNKSVHIAH
jgi:hypothetical protein